jgi:NAD(P)H-dependent flavin oxidoreductase YrpB (nitropropane dioxygenase family)
MTLQRLLGIDLPIIQAPMAGAQGSSLAVAVSNAGGLGSLPCAMLGPDAMSKELSAIKAGTDRSFNVNFFCHAPPAFPLAATAIAPLRAKAESRGLGDFSPLWAGQNASGCKAIPAAELTRELAAGL